MLTASQVGYGAGPPLAGEVPLPLSPALPDFLEPLGQSVTGAPPGPGPSRPCCSGYQFPSVFLAIFSVVGKGWTPDLD